MNHIKILLLEDEENLGETLNVYLKNLGYNLYWAKSCKEANSLFGEHHFDILLFDIGLPDGNGLDLAKSLRKKKKDTLLIFLSALNDPQTRVEGLEIGAEDFINKPFELKELVLRLERSIKAKDLLSLNPEEIQIGKLKIWFKRYEVLDGNNQIVPLGQKECAILELLYRRKNEAISRDEIINNVWGEDAFPSNRTVDNYIVHLRKWAETDPTNTLIISSIRGIGYKLEIKKSEEK